jgi:uncharacterized protein (TIGR04255 family)
LGLGDVDWRSLLNPTILGELSDPNLSGAIEQVSAQVLFLLDGRGKLRVRHGLAKSKSSGEICYVIDSDFFTEERTDTTNAIEILDHFNQQAGRLFRWCIQDRLHEAMGPRPIDS